MIGNKIADKIISAGTSKKDDKRKKVEEIYISPEKNTANYWWLETILNTNFTNLLCATLDEVPRFITKKWIKVLDLSGSAEDTNQAHKYDLKHQC